MGILNFIKQKTENQKKVFSLVLALILTIFIVGFWFSFSGDKKGESKENDSKLSSISPWQVIKDEFSQIFSGSKTEIGSSTIPVEILSPNLEVATGTASSSIISTTTSTSSNKI